MSVHPVHEEVQQRRTALIPMFSKPSEVREVMGWAHESTDLMTQVGLRTDLGGPPLAIVAVFPERVLQLTPEGLDAEGRARVADELEYKAQDNRAEATRLREQAEE